MDNIDEKLKLKKEFIKNHVLSEEAKNNIKQAMKEEYEKNEHDKKIGHSVKIYKKVIGAVACLLIISGVTFAGNIGDLFTNIFKNTEKNIEQSINPNSIIEINSEYVTFDGISLNVAYMYEDDEYIYIAMHIKGIDDVQDVMVDELKIDDITNNKIYSSLKSNGKNYSTVSLQYKKDSNILFTKMRKKEDIIINKLNLKIKNLILKEKNDNFNTVMGEWVFNIEKP